ncbi:MAG: hypothetical protein ABIV94_08835 [Acidimicrobiales bacterium]
MRRPSPRSLLAAATLALVTALACGNDSGPADREAPPDLNVIEGRARLDQIFGDTVAAVAPGVALRNLRSSGVRDCTNPRNQPDGTAQDGLFIDLDLIGRDEAEALQAVADHWRAEGFDVQDHLVDTEQPELLATSDGFQFSAISVPGTGLLTFSGSTPCLEPR